MLMRPMTRREHELLMVALRRAADFEATDYNVIAARLLREVAAEVERRPLRNVA
jgi:hypothetical protein